MAKFAACWCQTTAALPQEIIRRITTVDRSRMRSSANISTPLICIITLMRTSQASGDVPRAVPIHPSSVAIHASHIGYLLELMYIFVDAISLWKCVPGHGWREVSDPAQAHPTYAVLDEGRLEQSLVLHTTVCHKSNILSKQVELVTRP